MPTCKDDSKIIIGCAVPVEIARLTKDAARKDMISMSDLIRHAIVAELKSRGFIPETKTA